jgi:ribosome-binding protein aMBF1 (putative translation factor)
MAPQSLDGFRGYYPVIDTRTMKSGEDKERLKEFGKNLKRIRESKGYSLRSLSYECNIDYSDIGKIERGETNITLLTFLQLAEALKISPGELVDYIKPKE